MDRHPAVASTDSAAHYAFGGVGEQRQRQGERRKWEVGGKRRKRGAGRREHGVDGKEEDWRAGEEGSSHIPGMGDALLPPVPRHSQALPSCRTQFPHLQNGWSKVTFSSGSRWQGERREESWEPRCHILPLLLCSPPASQREGRGGARAAKAGALPARYSRSAAHSARRELTHSLGIYHAPNYNVNWQVPEIN